MQTTSEMGCEKVPEKELLFLGSPLLDITTPCSQEVLERYELKSDDCIRETEKQEALFRSLFRDPHTQMTAGGSSQNTARIAKWTLGDRGRVSFAGCVGEDDYATTLSQCLQSENVEALYIALPGHSTGVCACLLNPGGDRSMCARLGAAEHFASHHLQEEKIRERLRKSHCIFVEGYFFAHSPDVMLTLAEACSEHQVFSISLSAEYICRDHADTLVKVLPRIDVLFSNEAEAKVLARSLDTNDLSVENTARVLAAMDRSAEAKPRIVVVTRGPRPVLVAQGEGSLRTFPVPSGVKVVDGVGCGDALAGAFLAVYVLTGDVSLAAETGISAAVEIAQVSGCKPTQKKLYS